MTTKICNSVLASLIAFGLVACGGDSQAPADTSAAEKEADARAVAQTPSSPGSMFNVDYQIVGTPIIGSPVSIDLEVASNYGDMPIDLAFQIPDPSALLMDDAQPRRLTRAPLAGERLIRERVTIIPQREGRLFMNVRASHSDDGGTASTMISIPIHVGNVDTSLVEVGELQTNDEGETTRVLTSE